MIEIRRVQTVEDVIAAAAKLAAEALGQALAHSPQATFVLAGGRVPPQAFQALSDNYSQAFDWSRVQFLIGDERCVPFDSPDSSWLGIKSVLDARADINDANRLRPATNLPAEEAAQMYARTLSALATNEQGLPIFSHAWLGIGEDGHTLSLFPNHPSIQPTDELVIAVHDSPKPPPDRISFSLKALAGVESAVAFISGTSKAPIVKQIADGNHELPIVVASKTISRAGGRVIWLVDDEAASETPSMRQLKLG